MEDAVASYHAFTSSIVAAFGGDDKLVHVHVGLAIYLIAQVALRTRRASLDALLTVVLAEALNESLDRLFYGAWNWADTLGDIVATLFWPTALFALGRYRRARWARRERARRELARMLSPAHYGVS